MFTRVIGAPHVAGRPAVDLALALAGDEGLHDAVFERVETDHRQAAARHQQLERGVQALFELLKLGVDKNPKCLKCARCRILARFAGLDRTSHDVGKLTRGSNRVPALAPSNKRLCNLYSKPFFPIVAYHLGNVAHVGAGEKFRGAFAAGGVHAHVQRSVEAEAEAAGRVVDLRRRHAQVEQQPVHLRHAGGSQRGHELAEARVMDGKTRVRDPRCS
jgi:hypothetical protein